MLDKPASFSDEKLENAVEPVIMEMLNYMQSGCFYVLAHLTDWFSEFRGYYRREGVIVKEADDLISATRYVFMMRRFARVKRRIKRDVQTTRPDVEDDMTRCGGLVVAEPTKEMTMKLTERETTPGKY